MTLDAGTIIALVTALGGGATIKYLFDLITGRGKRKIEETVSLTEASKRVVDLVTAQADRTARDAEKVRDDLQATRLELRAARDEIHDLRNQVGHIGQIVNDERRWAERHGHTDAPILRIAR